MAHFLIRMSCEASHTVEADSVHQAARAGERLSIEQWDSVSWSAVEVEVSDEAAEQQRCRGDEDNVVTGSRARRVQTARPVGRKEQSMNTRPGGGAA